ncbi:hypothetical protein VHARVF571_600035 [Vibrio harveyi]|nr:hypothetical protein VHARVF571_600035 [Vibrio harveyi]
MISIKIVGFLYAILRAAQENSDTRVLQGFGLITEPSEKEEHSGVQKKQSPTKGNNNEKNNLQFSSGCCVSVSKCFCSQ